MKRLSGNYFDRLLFRTLPATTIATLIFILFSNTVIKLYPIFNLIVVVFLPLAIVLWLIDSIVLKLKKPVNLSIDGHQLLIDRIAIDTRFIIQISEWPDIRLGWDFTVLVLTFKKDGTFHSVNIIPKPKFNPIDNLLTIELLIRHFPDLKEKYHK